MASRGRSSARGSRGRSIRLRIFFLVAIPLLTVLGLFSYVAYTSVTNFQNLDRAPSLIQATSVPLTRFVTELQAERRAAVVYAAAPTSANEAAYTSAIQATATGPNGLKSFESVVDSPATENNATPAETAALSKMLTDVGKLGGLRTEVMAQKLTPVATLQAYTEDVILDQDTVFDAQAQSMTDTIASSQGLGLISSIDAREDISEEDAILAGALAANANGVSAATSLTSDERVAFAQAYGREIDDTNLSDAMLSPSELAEYNTVFNKQAPKTNNLLTDVQGDLTQVEEAVTSGAPLSQIQAGGITPATWQQLTSTWENANFNADLSAAATTLNIDQGLAITAKERVVEVGIGGGIGLLLTLIVTLLLGSSINRRLGVLRRAALTLAQEQLPSVVARLRRGESVDVSAEAPPLRHGRDEIGQVGEAIDAVRQTAIRSAIDEARVRQGVNDMFRNLARRNQSLLQRQLGVLDEAERRTTDPDVLDDLFKMDHLTTRMRRHAEGLIILSGSAPGRSWSQPVKLIDVMRGAVAEVEDYARVTVSTQSSASLSGSAVTDVIHLLAELIENATTLSPPYTQVRVSGETVANGFAIEIEDRGLGLNQGRLQELNQRLASPPEINPANTEQLGLFVVAQLARRHGLQVMLRTSPYGGTTAVALIPTPLIVEGSPAALPMGSDGATANGQPFDGQPNGAPMGAQPMQSRPMGGPGMGRPGDGRRAQMPIPGRGPDFADDDLPSRSPIRIGGHAGGGRGNSNGNGNGNGPASEQPMPIAAAAAAAVANGNAGNRRGRHSDEDVPVVTGVPVGRPGVGPGPQQPGGQPDEGEFDAFRPLRRAEQEGMPPFGNSPTGQQPYSSDFAARQDNGQYVSPYADPRSPNYQGDGIAYNAPSSHGKTANIGNGRDSGTGRQNGDDMNSGGVTSDGLPRRVRQASLAPQLRATAAKPAATQGATAAVPRASAASLADMRNTLSAMQRGWQQGRSQTQRESKGNGDGK
jgi:signal transduction histidine kinase